MLSSQLEVIQTILKEHLHRFQKESVNVYYGEPLTSQKLNKQRYYIINIGSSMGFEKFLINKYLNFSLEIEAVSIAKTIKISQFDVLDMLGFAIDNIFNRNIFRELNLKDLDILSFNGVEASHELDNYKKFKSVGKLIVSFSLRLGDFCE